LKRWEFVPKVPAYKVVTINVHDIFDLIILDIFLGLFGHNSFPHLLQIGCHRKYQNTRCFEVVRMDGTVEDFSYHKGCLAALEVVDPRRAKSYKSKWLQRSTA
jgi:hypothetical protein